mmetsp:Transcript_44572/g.82671  ORF Transcript_44572/g.82671 Transcript_44572/m.82671 type:complete len:443 (+) Transcript_44572:606-1934(+)
MDVAGASIHRIFVDGQDHIGLASACEMFFIDAIVLNFRNCKFRLASVRIGRVDIKTIYDIFVEVFVLESVLGQGISIAVVSALVSALLRTGISTREQTTNLCSSLPLQAPLALAHLHPHLEVPSQMGDSRQGIRRVHPPLTTFLLHQRLHSPALPRDGPSRLRRVGRARPLLVALHQGPPPPSLARDRRVRRRRQLHRRGARRADRRQRLARRPHLEAARPGVGRRVLRELRGRERHAEHGERQDEREAHERDDDHLEVVYLLPVVVELGLLPADVLDDLVDLAQVQLPVVVRVVLAQNLLVLVEVALVAEVVLLGHDRQSLLGAVPSSRGRLIELRLRILDGDGRVADGLLGGLVEVEGRLGVAPLGGPFVEGDGVRGGDALLVSSASLLRRLRRLDAATPAAAAGLLVEGLFVHERRLLQHLGAATFSSVTSILLLSLFW